MATDVKKLTLVGLFPFVVACPVQAGVALVPFAVACRLEREGAAPVPFAVPYHRVQEGVAHGPFVVQAFPSLVQVQHRGVHLVPMTDY